MEMLMYKKSIQEDNSKQKKQVMDLFEKMMKNSNSISPEIILQMFPGANDAQRSNKEYFTIKISNGNRGEYVE